jgi:hypothetical protein
LLCRSLTCRTPPPACPFGNPVPYYETAAPFVTKLSAVSFVIRYCCRVFFLAAITKYLFAYCKHSSLFIPSFSLRSNLLPPLRFQLRCTVLSCPYDLAHMLT